MGHVFTTYIPVLYSFFYILLVYKIVYNVQEYPINYMCDASPPPPQANTYELIKFSL